MSMFVAYLEFASDGNCMAHVPELPGCFSTGVGSDAALAVLKSAIQKYLEDLRRHGEPVEVCDEIQVDVNETIQEGTGPFHPGNTAALFEFEREPITVEEMESVYFRRAMYNRMDLLELVEGMVPEILDWTPVPDEMNIRQILRHIGNGDRWYVSRVIEPEKLPEEWQNVDDIPVFEYLEMVRRTALDRYRNLTEQECGQVVVPSHMTSNPTEPWSVRKALRRMLEHEREHTAHIREVLNKWRTVLHIRLAAERAGFLMQLVGLDKESLTSVEVMEGWTAKDLLAHVGEWDDFHAERMLLVRDGRLREIKELGGENALDVRNVVLHAEHRDLSLEDALRKCLAARYKFLDTLSTIPDGDLHKELVTHWGWKTSMQAWSRWRYLHDSEHCLQLQTWRDESRIKPAPGSKDLLVAATNAVRDEILAIVDWMPPKEWETRQVCGVWTLKDVVGHLTDWEALGVEAARLALDGVTKPAIEFPVDFQTWNETHAAIRKTQPWEQVWEDFTSTRKEFIKIIASLSQDDLVREFITPWCRNVYHWMAIWHAHEREHAEELREVLGHD